jgi:hypothetical protein
MFEQAYRYRFAQRIDLRDVGDTLLLAVLAADGLFGETRVRMDAAFATDPSINVLIVDASTVVGQAINGIFASFLMREFGPDAFDVKRVAVLREVWR